MALSEIVIVKKIDRVSLATSLNVSVPNANQTHFESTDKHNSYEVDVLSQLKANLSKIEDLSQKLHFVLGEVSHLIKKS